MERGEPKELITFMVRSGPPAKAGLGPRFGGCVAWGSSAPPYAVPSAVGVGVASTGARVAMGCAICIAEVEAVKNVRAQASMFMDLGILVCVKALRFLLQQV